MAGGKGSLRIDALGHHFSAYDITGGGDTLTGTGAGDVIDGRGGIDAGALPGAAFHAGKAAGHASDRIVHDRKAGTVAFDMMGRAAMTR